MKNTYIIVIVLVLVVLGVMFFMGGGSKVEAPTTESVNNPVNQEATSPTAEIPAPAVKEFTVTGKNFAFDPSTITVKKGDRVKITFINSQGFHDFVIDEYGLATKQIQSPSTEVIEFTADKVGSFEYYCSVGSHRAMGMKGILKVE